MRFLLIGIIELKLSEIVSFGQKQCNHLG